MDHARLARETVDKLVPYLAKLLSNYTLNASASKREREAFHLWRLIYPKIALRSRVIQAARKASVENTPENQEALTQQLTQLYRTNEHIASQVSNLIHHRTIEADERETNVPEKEARSQTTPDSKEYSAEQIACQVCGRQDETLRLVSYPYVFSLVIITFRRLFQGVYCTRHANRYFFLAVFITLTVGWMGIPFGFVFTPLTLFNLLRSDKSLRPANAKILMEIAKTKLEAGDPAAAAVYLKEALWLEDNDRVRSQVKSLGSNQVVVDQPGFFRQVIVLLGMFITIWLMGIFIGLVDGMVSAPFYGLEESVSILVIVFSYFPLLLMLFFSGFIAARVAAEGIQRAALRNIWAGRLLGVLLSIELVYAILSGRYVFISQMGRRFQTLAPIEKLMTFGWSAVYGGWQIVLQILQGGDPEYLLFIVLVLLAGVLFLWLLQDATPRMVRWRLAMDEILGKTNPESGNLALAGALILLLVLTLFFVVIFSSSGISPF